MISLFIISSFATIFSVLFDKPSSFLLIFKNINIAITPNSINNIIKDFFFIEFLNSSTGSCKYPLI